MVFFSLPYHHDFRSLARLLVNTGQFGKNGLFTVHSYVRWRTFRTIVDSSDARGFCMARDLVWLQNFNFAAWSCSACGWLTPTGTKASMEVPAPVRAAFAQHNCSEFPCFIPKEKRPPRRVEL
jgi:hypothetical protein